MRSYTAMRTLDVAHGGCLLRVPGRADDVERQPQRRLGRLELRCPRGHALQRGAATGPAPPASAAAVGTRVRLAAGDAGWDGLSRISITSTMPPLAAPAMCGKHDCGSFDVFQEKVNKGRDLVRLCHFLHAAPRVQGREEDIIDTCPSSSIAPSCRGSGEGKAATLH